MLGGMTDTPVTPRPATPATRIWVLGLAVVLAALIYVPFYGPLVSVVLPLWTHGKREALWPTASGRASLWCSVAAWVGLWCPALLDLFTPVFWNAGVQISTSWLVIPLCGPDVAAATYAPALVASGVCIVGSSDVVASEAMARLPRRRDGMGPAGRRGLPGRRVLSA